MSRFSLNAELQLRAPTNANQVLAQVQRQLSGLTVPITVTGQAEVQRGLRNTDREINRVRKSTTGLTRGFAVLTRRFAAFSIATRAVSLLTNKLSSAVDEAIAFEREINKISQVTGKTAGELRGLTKEITRLATTLGVSSGELANVGRVLSQAGFKAGDLKVALSALAKTDLAPTFDNLGKTTEGAIAIFNQFGKGAAALESQLGAVNAVAGKFAVEASDLIGAVSRVGGVFASAGGDLNQLIGLFTSVRATTRESAESIATGLRTILTRIQRPTTIRYLDDLGVSLTDVNGKFKGPFEAIQALGKAFSKLPKGDLRFVQIAEELGGFRQIGKVIPLIQQFTVAEQARQVALAGGNSLNDDVKTAQKSLAVQISQLKEEWIGLVRSFADTGTFRTMVKLTLQLASTIAKVVDSIKPLLPLIATLGAVKLGGALFGALGPRLTGRNQGGPIGFARGGVVPGSGNGDTVPAMLTPGEFVIKKSSVGKIGTDTLHSMNEQKFAYGGKVAKSNVPVGLLYKNTGNDADPPDIRGLQAPISAISKKDDKQRLKDAGITHLEIAEIETSQFVTTKTADNVFDGIKESISNKIKTLNKSAGQIRSGGKAPAPISDKKILKSLDLSLGRVFEDYIGNILGIGTPGNRNFDLDSPSEIESINQQNLANEKIKAGIADIKLNDGPAARKTLFKKSFNEGFFDRSVSTIIGIQNRDKGIQNKANGGFIEPVMQTLFASDGADVRLGTTNKTRGMTFDEAVARGFNKNTLNRGFGKDFVDSKLGTGLERQRAKEAKASLEGLDDNTGFTYGAAFLEKVNNSRSGLKKLTLNNKKLGYTLKTAYLDKSDSEKIKNDFVKDDVEQAIGKTSNYLASLVGQKPIKGGRIPNLQAIAGSIFEAGLTRVSGSSLALEADDNRIFDFAGGLGSAAGVFGPDGEALKNIKTDAKVASTKSALESIKDKVRSDLKANGYARGGMVQGFAEGGRVGIFDSDYISGGTKDKNAILESILGKNVVSAIWGPAGSGKSTLARSRYGNNLVGSIADVANYDDFAVISGAGKTKAGGFSPAAAKIFSKAAKIIALLPDDAELDKRRSKRIKTADDVIKGGDKRSAEQLAGSAKAPKSDSSLVAELKKFGKPIEYLATGGGIGGTDTVPAMLTPGEFVINKEAASKIGSSRLNRMNKSGVTGFAKGGPVGKVQKFAGGGEAGGGLGSLGLIVALQGIPTILQSFSGDVDESGNKVRTTMSAIADGLGGLVTPITAVITALQIFGLELSRKTFKGGVSDGIGRRINRFRGGRGSFTDGFRGGNSRSEIAAQIKLLRSQGATNSSIKDSLFIPTKGSKFGTFLGKKAAGGSRIASLVGRGITRVGGTALGSVVGGAGGLAGGAVTALAGIAGPATGAVLALTAVSSGLNALFGESEKYNKAVREGNVAEAERAALLKESNGFVQLGNKLWPGFASGMAGFMTKYFGSDSEDSIKLGAKAAALGAKIEKEKEKNLKDANKALARFTKGLGTSEEAIKGFSVSNKDRIERYKTLVAAGQDKFDPSQRSSDETWTTTNILKLGGIYGLETGGQRNKRREAEGKASYEEARAVQGEIANDLQLSLEKLLPTLDISGKSFDQFLASHKDFARDYSFIGRKQQAELRDLFDNEKSIREANLAYLKSLNFGLSKLNSAIDAVDIQLGVFRANQAGTTNKFTNAAKIGRAAIGSGAEFINPKDVAQVSSILNEVILGMGGTAEQAEETTNSFKGLNKIQAAFPAIFKKIQSEATGRGIGDTFSGTKLINFIEKEFAAVLGNNPDALKRVSGVLRQLDTDPEAQKKLEQAINAKDAAAFQDVLSGKLSDEQSKQIFNLLEKRGKVEQEQINAIRGFIKQRQSAENELLEAEKQGIEDRLFAAKESQSFGGKRISAADRLEARRSQLDLSVRNAGISSRGSVIDIAKTLLNNNRVEAQKRDDRIRAGASDGSARPEDGEKFTERAKLAKDLITFEKQKISIIKDEINVLNKRNKFNKSALESLISGNAKGYFRGLAKAEISRDLSLGRSTANADLENLLDAVNLNLSTGTINDDQAISAITSNRQARALAIGEVQAGQLLGITPGGRDLKKQGQESLENINAISSLSSALKTFDITSIQKVIEVTNKNFEDTLNNSSTIMKMMNDNTKDLAEVLGRDMKMSAIVDVNVNIDRTDLKDMKDLGETIAKIVNKGLAGLTLGTNIGEINYTPVTGDDAK